MERRVPGKGGSQKFRGGKKAGSGTKWLGKGMQAQMQEVGRRRVLGGEEWAQSPEGLGATRTKRGFSFGSTRRMLCGAPPLRSCGPGADAVPLGLFLGALPLPPA